MKAEGVAECRVFRRNIRSDVAHAISPGIGTTGTFTASASFFDDATSVDHSVEVATISCGSTTPKMASA